MDEEKHYNYSFPFGFTVAVVCSEDIIGCNRALTGKMVYADPSGNIYYEIR